jgi:hypothetical protein
MMLNCSRGSRATPRAGGETEGTHFADQNQALVRSYASAAHFELTTPRRGLR